MRLNEITRAVLVNLATMSSIIQNISAEKNIFKKFLCLYGPLCLHNLWFQSVFNVKIMSP